MIIEARVEKTRNEKWVKLVPTVRCDLAPANFLAGELQPGDIVEITVEKVR